MTERWDDPPADPASEAEIHSLETLLERSRFDPSPTWRGQLRRQLAETLRIEGIRPRPVHLHLLIVVYALAGAGCLLLLLVGILFGAGPFAVH
jgi:hypothetical protein